MSFTAYVCIPYQKYCLFYSNSRLMPNAMPNQDRKMGATGRRGRKERRDDGENLRHRLRQRASSCMFSLSGFFVCLITSLPCSSLKIQNLTVFGYSLYPPLLHRCTENYKNLYILYRFYFTFLSLQSVSREEMHSEEVPYIMITVTPKSSQGK